MCGLWGVYSSQITQSEREMFVELGKVSALRGEDSTGVIIGSRKKKGGHKFKVNIKKAVENPCTFLSTWEVMQAIREDHTFLLSGHCRHTTSGATNFHNAHPIQSGKIILQHNGTISKWEPAKGKEEKTSDSRIFAGKIASLGVEAACKEAEFGHYAITFVDTEKKTFNVIRNSGRTLYAVFTNDQETVMWSSEAEFLELILKRNGVRHNWGNVQIFPLHKHFEWSFYGNAGKGEHRSIEVFDHSKYASNIADDPRYKEWLKDHSSMADGFGDPAFKEDTVGEDWNEYLYGANDKETSEQEVAQPYKGQAIICNGCEKDAQYCMCMPEQPPAGSGAFCKNCKERLGICQCKSTSVIYPPPWELDSKGRWRPEAANKHTSVPSIGKPPIDSPVGKLEKWFNGDTDNDSYLGFMRQPMAPSIAVERLKGGCGICGHESKPTEPVFWYSEYGHICPDCNSGKQADEYLGNVSRFISKYIKGDANAAVH